MFESHPTLSLLKEHKIEVFLLLILGGLLYYIYSSFSEAPQIEQFEEPEYVLQLNEVKIEDYWLDQNRWRLLGKQASVSKDNRLVFLNDVKILVYNPQIPGKREIDIVVTADKGTIDWKKGLVTLTSKVIMTRQSDIRINTEKATYQYNEGVLYIPEKVVMHYLQDTVIGEELTYNIHQKTTQLVDGIWLE
ncbi:MAG: LPS export ABC transporter periplasmic protein LptC [SAR324 cluster bacterium]|nr:LPS export ABC transporter periplasmic protein LptC [SAR324 cluster bacterium]